jgi:hypothetical protein
MSSRAQAWKRLLRIWLNEIETKQLYHELTAYFGLIGATNEFQALTDYGAGEIETPFITS